MSFSKYILPTPVEAITSDQIIIEDNIPLKENLDRINVFEANVVADGKLLNLYEVSLDYLDDTTSFDVTNSAETAEALNTYYNNDDQVIIINGPVDVTLEFNELEIPNDETLEKISLGYDTVYFNATYLGTGNEGSDFIITPTCVAYDSEGNSYEESMTTDNFIDGCFGTLNSTYKKMKFSLRIQTFLASSVMKINAFAWGFGNRSVGKEGIVCSDGMLLRDKVGDAKLLTEDQTLSGAINEVFQDVDNGKNVIATAITDMGVETGSNDTFETMASNISKITTGIDTSDGTAIASEILTGKVAYVAGSRVEGTMANNGAVSQTLATEGASYTIPEGYHNGSGKVTANITNLTAANIASGVIVGGITGTYDPSAGMTATAANILTGKTAYVAGSAITGTMPNLSLVDSVDFNSSNASKVIPCNAMWVGDNTDGVRRLSVQYNYNNGYIQAGTHFGFKSRTVTITPSASAQSVSSTTADGILESVTVNAVSNLSAGNIKKGVNVGGVVGTYDPIDGIGLVAYTQAVTGTIYYAQTGAFDNISQNCFYCKATETVLTNTTSPYGALIWISKVVDKNGVEYSGTFNFYRDTSNRCYSPVHGNNYSPFFSAYSYVFRHSNWYAVSSNPSGTQPSGGDCTIYYTYLVPSWKYGYGYSTTGGSTNLPSI